MFSEGQENELSSLPFLFLPAALIPVAGKNDCGTNDCGTIDHHPFIVRMLICLGDSRHIAFDLFC